MVIGDKLPDQGDSHRIKYRTVWRVDSQASRVGTSNHQPCQQSDLHGLIE